MRTALSQRSPCGPRKSADYRVMPPPLEPQTPLIGWRAQWTRSGPVIRKRTRVTTCLCQRRRFHRHVHFRTRSITWRERGSGWTGRWCGPSRGRYRNVCRCRQPGRTCGIPARNVFWGGELRPHFIQPWLAGRPEVRLPRDRDNIMTHAQPTAARGTRSTDRDVNS